MKQIKKILAVVLIVCLLMCTFNGCDKEADILMASKCTSYTVNNDGSETMVSYTITTVYSDGTNVIKCYSPTGTLWFTMDENGTTHTNAYTEDIMETHNKACGIMSLVGTNSSDLIYEIKENANGFTTDEYFSTKSGKYPALHMKYEILEDNIP